MKKIFMMLIISTVISTSLLSGCTTVETKQEETQTETTTEVVQTQEPNYISREEVKYSITGIQEDYVLLDLRKSADYETGHIINAFSADVDPAISNSDDATAVENLKSALKKATKSETGNDKKLILLCYSGKKYAEAATRLLQENGVENSRIFTLEGGYKGWTDNDATGEYKYLIDAVELAADTNEPNNFTTSLYQVPRTSDLYFSPEEVKTLIESKEIENYYVIDTRTNEEYIDGHLITAKNAADFVIPKKNIFLSRDEVISNVKAMFEKYPYSEGQKFIVICRGGKGGAQNMDDILREEFKMNNEDIYTLQFGYVAFPESWTKLGEDYMKFDIKGEEPGDI